ncbi:MAG: hypothetical protein ACP5I6_01660 [Caldisphaera sp.]|jgi:uncharacterized membrane protein|nr:hypothetical protein [Caldisphaera sp.]PMP60753.1 MAG: hypothetical protein C0201_01795 [Caldisphaera sp.]PMP91412.1 MAG: hypothetical protein C0171_02615 [Caldisphaera sp.]
MIFNIAIVFAALGITLLELSEATAMGIALYLDTHKMLNFISVALGAIIILIPTFIAGKYIALLPIFYIRITAASLLLYFGLRLARSTHRTVLRSRKKANFKQEDEHKDFFIAGFTVGLIESLEAAIVLIALLPISFSSTFLGFIIAIILIIMIGYILKEKISKIRVPLMKLFVSSLLLSFSLFWYIENVYELNELLLIPIFIIFVLIVRIYAYRN